jgi:hypothetical protein
MASIIWLVRNLVVSSLVKELETHTKPTMNIIFIINTYFSQDFFYIFLYVKFCFQNWIKYMIKYLIKIFQRFKEIVTNKLEQVGKFWFFYLSMLFWFLQLCCWKHVKWFN